MASPLICRFSVMVTPPRPLLSHWLLQIFNILEIFLAQGCPSVLWKVSLYPWIIKVQTMWGWLVISKTTPGSLPIMLWWEWKRKQNSNENQCCIPVFLIISYSKYSNLHKVCEDVNTRFQCGTFFFTVWTQHC